MLVSNSMESQYIQGAKYLWLLPSVDEQLVFNLVNTYSLSFPIAQTLVARGLYEQEVVRSFLFPSHEEDVGDPLALKDAHKAVERICEAVRNKEKILIFGDYDVDGITSTSMMLACLLPLGAQVNFFLPHRVKDGYGLSVRVVERAVKAGYTLIITVDNGITAIDAVARGNELGIDTIITDHHRPHAEVPAAYAIVNPNQVDCTYPYKTLAGVGVTFKLLSLLYRYQGRTLPAKVYELLVLGTIADVVPLFQENRFWVRYGLQHINNHESLSIRTLKYNAKKGAGEPLNSSDVGFLIGPQVNALGRLEDPREGVAFFLSCDEREVAQIGQKLCELNQTRRQLEGEIVSMIKQQVESKQIDLEKDSVVIAAHDSWSPGVIGLVASRIVELYGRPTLLFHITNHGVAKGSCRSIPAFNIFNALQSCKDLLISFGGHSLAAGLSLKIEHLPLLKQQLNEAINAQLTEFDLQQKLSVDAIVKLSDVNKRMMADLSYMEPFGCDNSKPLFLMREVLLVDKPVLLKEHHVKCMIFSEGVIKPVIFFNRPELYDWLCQRREQSFSLVGKVTENSWRGNVSIELQGIDVA
ncbi:MAG: single-stranded-DNA-specific exonuclease RecJ [Candidatus Babeliales bacterium]